MFNLKLSECFVFLSIDIFQKEILYHLEKKIQTVLAQFSQTQLIDNEDLLGVFFYFLKELNQEFTLQVDPEEKYISLIEGNNQSQLLFHNLRIISQLDITKSLEDLIHFTQTTTLEAFLIVDGKNWKKFRISMLVISTSANVYDNFMNFIENLHYNEIYKKTSFFIKDFVNLAKKKSLKNSFSLNLNKFLEFCGQIDPILEGNRENRSVSKEIRSLENQVCAIIEKENGKPVELIYLDISQRCIIQQSFLLSCVSVPYVHHSLLPNLYSLSKLTQ